jgi:hypothetical protein
MKNIVRLAKIFDNFVELDSSFVLVEDIKAIRKVKGASHGSETQDINGIEVVTPYGKYFDSTDFDSFKTRLSDTLAALKERAEPKEMERVQRRIIPIEDNSSNTAPAAPMVRSPAPSLKENAGPVTARRTSVEGFGKNGANGFLFPEGSPFKVVNRELLEIQGVDGSILAKGTAGGIIQGDAVSGVIYENGKYTLADKVGVAKVVVVYQVQGK